MLRAQKSSGTSLSSESSRGYPHICFGGRASTSTFRNRVRMTIVEVTRRAGGIVPTRALRAAGFSDHAIRQALATRQIYRVRKGWVATRDVDPAVIRAVRAHGVLTCLSEAIRRGLWAINDGQIHIAARKHAGGIKSTGCVVHWAEPAIPRHPDVAADSLENCLLLVADCQPHERAVVIWESAMNKALVTAESMGRLPLSRRARAVLATATPWSDSGLESIAMTRLRFLDVRILQQIVIAGRPVDLLIGDRLVVQIDGGHHVGPQRDKDIAHDALLITMGYVVIRVSYDQVVNHWPEVQHRIMQAVAQGVHLAA